MKFGHVILAALPLLAVAAPVQAHAILVESTPAINATQPAGRVALWLRYNSRIDAGRSRLTLVAADGSQLVVAIDPGLPPDILSASIVLPAGSWRLRWQVLAVDGHITRGDVPFTLTPP
jgi:methionine-rich copper-binding protein CopC